MKIKVISQSLTNRWSDANNIKVKEAEYKPDKYGFTEDEIALTFHSGDRLYELIFTNEQFEEFKKNMEVITEHQSLGKIGKNKLNCYLK